MLNKDKFKTADERVKAFHDWCADRKCNSCVFSEMCGGCDERTVGIDVMAHWLELESEEKLEPCPFCGGKCVEATPCEEHPHIVKCIKCGYTTPENAYKTFADAVAAHNRVARAVKVARAVRAAEIKKGE